MVTTLLLSSLVSLATLGLLLWRRRKPQTLPLPTHTYGGTNSQAHQRLQLGPPPWLLWLLVGLATLSIAGAYYRDESESLKTQPTVDTIVWVDRSLSSWLSFTNAPQMADELANELVRTSGTLRFLIPSTHWDESTQKWLQQVQLESATNVAEATAIIKRQFDSQSGSAPIPFSTDLTLNVVREAFRQAPELKAQKGRLVVISDAQRDSLQDLSLLSDSFADFRLLALPPAAAAATSSNEITPAHLFTAWQESATSEPSEPTTPTDPNDPEPPGTPAQPTTDFVSESEWGFVKTIPREARPELFLSQLSALNNDGSVAAAHPKALFVTSMESGLVATTDRSVSDGQRSLFTHCSAFPSGTSEMSPLADLQALSRFLGLKIRTTECTEQASLDRVVDRAHLWAFRRPSLWLVPATPPVQNTLSFQKQLWIPEGFRMGQDSLFYYATHLGQETGATDAENASILLREIVQLESHALPRPYFLSPLPPVHDLSAPQAPAEGDDINAAAERDWDSFTFRPIHEAADKTPLIFQWGMEPVYYLRTTLAMPNGELGRSRLWPEFWLGALSNSGGNRGGLTLHRLRRPPRESWELPAPEELERLNLESLNFEENTTGSANAKIQPGLFRNKETGHLHLIEFPEEEMLGQFLAEDTLRAYFQLTEEAAAPTSQTADDATLPLHTILAVVAALLSLSLYWVRLHRGQAREADPKPHTPLTKHLSLLLGGVLLSCATGAALPEASQAQDNFDLREQLRGLPQGVAPFLRPGRQKLPNEIIVPFRISWCSEGNRARVTQLYLQYRNMLEARGTIHLSRNLLFGQCYPGGSEVWWSDTVDDFDPSFLKTHVRSGGVFVIEAQDKTSMDHADAIDELKNLEEPAVGLRWESPEKRGMLYRSFYLLQTFDGCVRDNTQMLTLRKKETAKSPVGIVTSTRFLTGGSGPEDCFQGDQEYRSRSFVNLFYTLLTTDYKEDQLKLPELLRRVRNLGLEP